jgi:uncharacterized protein (DUF952 family)
MLIFKICTQQAWTDAIAKGAFRGSADDVRDGFIHLSTAEQLPGTAAKFFIGQDTLVVVAFDAAALGPALRWEPSRGGALFPHLYAPLPTSLALWVRQAPLSPDGVPVMPEEVATC